MKFIRLLLTLIVPLTLFFHSCNKSEDTITLIPINYQGTVQIWFNEDYGEKKLYEGNKRVYIIPSDGVLRTQFTPQFGWHYPEYYYITDDNKRIPIQAITGPLESVLDTLDSTKTYAYQFRTQGDTFKIDSLGNTIETKQSGIIFKIGNPLKN